MLQQQEGQNLLELVLDSHGTEVFGSDRGSFKVAFNGFTDPYNVFGGEGVSIEPGYKTVILLTVAETAADESQLSSYSLEDRKCR